MENKMVTTLAELQIYNKQPHDLSKEDIIGKHLESLDKWEEFFSKYSKWMGFSVRKEDVRRDHENNLWQQNRLAGLFWADGISRRDYACFGDIMAFDSTYKKNSYNKPLLIFVGLNHHYRTIVFAVAFLYDETDETYTWVLEEFLECMKNKPPPVVVTDGDHAMAKAIQKVFLTSVHRLCAWNLQNNVTINAHHPVFKSKFNELLYQYCTEEDFEDTWNRIVSEFEFEDSRWATTTCNSRRSWAECFLRGHFFGGLRTTQRSESINSYLSHFLMSKLKLRDLVGQVDKAIQSIRHTKWEDEFISNHSTPQLPSNILRQYYE
ncbi:protein FAR-RED IMPAIRED RESPONSE 1-like [Humulus lupulus]|uniref:protein FAR-RED IMPAIRED RESPONSE 1-like n=1 Tax=Humulus lupulus TaxID=3486 RepID=UPI002B4183A5|nr:protein FAR-RED IMPAIRED RESPONSE 1-like [Humulus lupulus]